jgi:hypothetical protein
MYTMSFTEVAVSAAQDLFSLASPTKGVAILHSVDLMQATDVGDAAEIIEEILIETGARTVGSGGSAGTESPVDDGDAAATCVGRINDTTRAVAGGGTIVRKHTGGWNVRVPFEYHPPPEELIPWGEIAAGTTIHLVVAMLNAPASAITCSGTIKWEEIG